MVESHQLCAHNPLPKRRRRSAWAGHADQRCLPCYCCQDAMDLAINFIHDNIVTRFTPLQPHATHTEFLTVYIAGLVTSWFFSLLVPAVDYALFYTQRSKRDTRIKKIMMEHTEGTRPFADPLFKGLPPALLFVFPRSLYAYILSGSHFMQISRGVIFLECC